MKFKYLTSGVFEMIYTAEGQKVSSMFASEKQNVKSAKRKYHEWKFERLLAKKYERICGKKWCDHKERQERNDPSKNGDGLSRRR